MGVNESQLDDWRKEARLEGTAAFPGSGRLTPLEDEDLRLEAEVKRSGMERDIPKKAGAFFATPTK